MSHINYNHLYYFWHVYKEGSVVGAAEALYLTPQTITGQIRALEERLQGKLFKRKGRGLEPSELGELVYRYADKMFTLIHLRCFESTHEMLLEQLSQHKLDMIISDCPIDSTQQEGLFSVRIGECGVSFWCTNPPPEKPFPACLEERRLLIPGRRSMLGRKLLNWFNSQGLNVEILGEFDDAALMKAFGAMHNAIFVAPTLYAYDFYADKTVVEIGRVENVMEEYHAIFAERMIQHPAVQRICNTDYS
ncbi:MAG: transcriptional activator NhaR, partial [Escherichia coli]|nr:transcriptional activator NhaR [Escherichia coli]